METEKEKLTLLVELEALYDACLIASKQEASPLVGLCCERLLRVDFWAKLDTSAHDAILLDRNRVGPGWWYLKVILGVGLSNMGSERAAELRADLSGVGKIVVSVQLFFSFLESLLKRWVPTSLGLFRGHHHPRMELCRRVHLSSEFH